MHRIWIWLLLIVVILAGAVTFEPGTPPAVEKPAQPVVQPMIDFSELEKVALEELKETNTPGAAVAVVSGDKIIFAKGFGTSNIETGAPVAPEMLFRIGSTTKMYTAAALVTLAEEGKIKLNEPIGKYVKGLSPKLSQLTAHQLMTHTAGLKDESPSYGLHDESALASTVRSWTDDYLFTEPGEVFSYANPGLTLAGLVVEDIGGKPYAEVISERLFQPLGMTRTTFRPTLAMTYPLSQGHQTQDNEKPTVVRPFADNAGYWPAGFIISNVYDFSRFAIAFMNRSMIDGKQGLAPSVIAKLSTPYVALPSVFEGAKYGYGLVIHDRDYAFESGSKRLFQQPAAIFSHSCYSCFVSMLDCAIMEAWTSRKTWKPIVASTTSLGSNSSIF